MCSSYSSYLLENKITKKCLRFIVFPFWIGVKLHEPDRVVEKLEQSIRSREDSVDSNCCVRSRGLPWQASDQDIARFFIGLNVARYDTHTKKNYIYVFTYIIYYIFQGEIWLFTPFSNLLIMLNRKSMKKFVKSFVRKNATYLIICTWTV